MIHVYGEMCIFIYIYNYEIVDETEAKLNFCEKNTKTLTNKYDCKWANIVWNYLLSNLRQTRIYFCLMNIVYTQFDIIDTLRRMIEKTNIPEVIEVIGLCHSLSVGNIVKCNSLLMPSHHNWICKWLLKFFAWNSQTTQRNANMQFS